MPGTPEEAVHSLPPFPPAGVSPDDRNQPPPHPNAEALFNATAQHVFPEKPAPREDEGGKKGVIRDGLDGDGDLDEEGEEREEEPIMRGTPLEEMETRMLERRSLLAEYKTRGRNESGAQNGGAPLVKVPEDEEVEGLTPARSTGPGAGKPGFGLMRDMGSVSEGL